MRDESERLPTQDRRPARTWRQISSHDVSILNHFFHTSDLQTQSIHLPPGLDLLKGTVGSKWQTWSEPCPVSSNISWSETYWILLVKRPNINKDTNPPSDILYGNFRHSPLPDYQSYLLTCIITYFFQVNVFFKKIKILSFIHKPFLAGWTLCEGGRRRRRRRHVNISLWAASHHHCLLTDWGRRKQPRLQSPCVHASEAAWLEHEAACMLSLITFLLKKVKIITRKQSYPQHGGFSPLLIYVQDLEEKYQRAPSFSIIKSALSRDPPTNREKW